jgi:hypothetical protein
MGLCLISDVNYYWLDWLIGLLFISKVSFRIAICKLAWWAAVYHLWQQRNAVIHSGKIRTEEQIIKDVKRDVKNAEALLLPLCLMESCVINGESALLSSVPCLLSRLQMFEERTLCYRYLVWCSSKNKKKISCLVCSLLA